MTPLLAFFLIFQVNIQVTKKEARTKIARFRAMGQYERIIEVSDLVLKRYPEDFEFFKYKIDAFIRLGKKDTVKKLIEGYLTKKRAPRVYRDLYSLLYFSGEKDFALRILQIGRQDIGSDTLFAREFYYLNLWDKNFRDALYELFNFYLQTGSITLLRQEFRRIEKFFDEATIKGIVYNWLKKHPTHREVRIVLADYYRRRDDPDKMLKELRISGYTKNLKDFAWYLISTGDYAKADSLLDLETKRDGGWYFLKAQTLQKLKNYRKSVEFYEKAYTKFHVKEANDSLVNLLFFRLKDYKTVLKYSHSGDELRIRALLALGQDTTFLKLPVSNETTLFYRGLYFFIHARTDSAEYYWGRLARRFPSSKYLYRVFFLKEIREIYGKTGIFEKFITLENLILRWNIDSAMKFVRLYLKEDSTGLMKFELAKLQELNGDYELALSTYIDLGDGESNFLSPYSYFRAFKIARENLKNPELSGEIGEKLIERYPTSPYASAVRSLL